MFRNAGRSIAFPAVLGAVLACVLLSSNTVRAADYSVDFGVDTVALGKDAGTLTCQLKQTCNAKIESLGLNISVRLSWKKSGEATVKLENGDLTCCYFPGGGRSATVDAQTKLSRLQFFKGSAPRGGLFITNEHAGILYLRFDLQ